MNYEECLVAIPTYNRFDLLEKLLTDLKEIWLNDILVVFQGYTEEQINHLKNKFNIIADVCPVVNVSYARNHIIKTYSNKYKFIVLLDDDSDVRKYKHYYKKNKKYFVLANPITRLLDIIDSKKEIGVLAPIQSPFYKFRRSEWDYEGITIKRSYNCAGMVSVRTDVYNTYNCIHDVSFALRGDMDFCLQVLNNSPYECCETTNVMYSEKGRTGVNEGGIDKSTYFEKKNKYINELINKWPRSITKTKRDNLKRLSFKNKSKNYESYFQFDGENNTSNKLEKFINF